ncbi:MAG: biotin/lipoyl-binding protein [Bacteroidota bacterium]
MPLFLRQSLRIGTTLVVVALALNLVAALWHHYMIAPWTRDGRVRADTVAVAPEISGPVTDVRVSDNQLVHKGDVLFVIDPERYRLAEVTATAVAESRKQDMRVAQLKSERRARQTDLTVSSEEREQFVGAAAAAAANYDQAVAQLALARLNTSKTVVRSPVNGYVTNLRLRPGDYVNAGQTATVVVDKESFWVAAYFEETKLSQVKAGAPVFVQLMGYDTPLAGHVVSLTRGISDQNGEPGTTGLANVNPVFTWVRLAQRIPVRVQLDGMPQDVDIAAGMTCTVNLASSQALKTDAWFLLRWLRANLF